MKTIFSLLHTKSFCCPRKLPLFMSPPRDPLIDRTPFWKDTMYQVIGNMYGLPNAPYLWTEEVVGRLTSCFPYQNLLNKHGNVPICSFIQGGPNISGNLGQKFEVPDCHTVKGAILPLFDQHLGREKKPPTVPVQQWLIRNKSN